MNGYNRLMREGEIQMKALGVIFAMCLTMAALADDFSFSFRYGRGHVVRPEPVCVYPYIYPSYIFPAPICYPPTYYVYPRHFHPYYTTYAIPRAYVHPRPYAYHRPIIIRHRPEYRPLPPRHAPLRGHSPRGHR